MKVKSFFLLSFFLLTNAVHAQLTSLCGIWIGHNYSCYTIDPTSTIIDGYGLLEVILIEQNGTSITATKLLGDDCVETGHVTWSGIYTSNTFPVVVTLGNPLNPNSNYVSGNIIVVDSNRLESDVGVYFTRATCQELQEFDLDLSNIDSFCPAYISSVNMPNVFTPDGDGINDFCIPIDCANCEDYELAIYNRWGNCVFESSDPLHGWNGNLGNQALNEGSYFWRITISDRMTCETTRHTGVVTLIR